MNVRQDSAKALLLVVIGDFAWREGGPIWSSVLLDALSELDIEVNAARKALRRTAESGLISAGREGRRVHWSITARGQEVLASGDVQTYGWADRDRSWDGRWLMLSLTIPEAQRNLRHRLHTRLEWAGLGSPVPGQWLTPHWSRANLVASAIRELGLEEHAHSMIGTIGPIGSEEDLARSAFDLAALRQQYDDFVRDHEQVKPADDRECFVAVVELVQDWRRFPYLDPDLPERFLPVDWPGDRAARLFQDRYRAWTEGAQRHWRALRGRS
ncbi:PaaX family transcriptional regulator C-terminal domain-containing protein [Pseudonocardia sp. NPDC049154]|uniref:PaaX family transcriptional regulator n=1 Tax=Pseudonocardia sp. NPDC049154 TaxID=3155501 RepID=UPI0034082C88